MKVVVEDDFVVLQHTRGMGRLYAKTTRRRRFQCLPTRNKCLKYIRDILTLSLQVYHSREFQKDASLRFRLAVVLLFVAREEIT